VDSKANGENKALHVRFLIPVDHRERYWQDIPTGIRWKMMSKLEDLALTSLMTLSQSLHGSLKVNGAEIDQRQRG